MNVGARISANKSRERAIKRYYENPLRCLHCDEILYVGENQKVSEVRRKKFCNHSCAAKYNNLRRESPEKCSRRTLYKICECEQCHCEITLQRVKGKSFLKRKFCDDCLQYNRNAFKRLTKGELFEKRGNWQSARSSIQKDARKIIKDNNPSCAICGYSTHIEVAHIKAVSEFDDTSLISEINDRRNLIFLCPNHHWEYDNLKTKK